MRRSARLQAGQGPPQPPTTTSSSTQIAPQGPLCPSTTSGSRQVLLQPPTTRSRTRQVVPPGSTCPPSAGTRHGASTGPTLPGAMPPHPGPSLRTRQAAPPGGQSWHSFAFSNISQIFLASTGPPHPGSRSGVRSVPGQRAKQTAPPGGSSLYSMHFRTFHRHFLLQQDLHIHDQGQLEQGGHR